MGELVEELNAIEAAKKARGASEERVQQVLVIKPSLKQPEFTPVVASPTKLSPPLSGDLSASSGTESPASVADELEFHKAGIERRAVEDSIADHCST